MANEQKFSGRAGQYSSARPSYAESMVQEMYDKLGLTPESVIADIGSGTGKFSRSFLERGNNVICVEPNDEMRKQAEKDMSGYDGFVSVGASAEHTGLADHSIDAITCAQSFHWFDVTRFRRECNRILKPNGKVFLTWNMPLRTCLRLLVLQVLQLRLLPVCIWLKHTLHTHGGWKTQTTFLPILPLTVN